MRTIFTQRIALCLLALFFAVSHVNLFAQCNVNEKYDKIISGYHSSIALKTDGVYAVWGSAMKSTGVVTSGDAFSPQDINVTNYPGLTGTILKAALGGKNAGAAVDQAILLTTDGLWAWGIVSNVLSSTSTPVIKSTAAFGRTYSTAANGFNTYGLPTSVTPNDVQSMYAAYQTLVIVTKIVSGVGGDVWILTQTTQAVEGNNGTAATAGSSRWMHVMKSTTAGDYLTNVVAVRGQVSNATYNAFMAQTQAGLVYTWGNTTYLGNNTASAARTVATQMTMPTESGNAVIPKLIGVTGGIGTTTTTKNTYYVLSNAGNLYALGHNSQKQCGDFTVTERLNWVQVQKSATAGDYLTNINFFTCQEHNSSYPAIAAITTTGALYTWGNNSSGMLARSDNAAVGGTLAATTTCDPGLTAGVSGIVITAEMGGHTLVYLKEGNNQFCYAGHYVDGSMGDGGTGNNGTSAATTLTLNCSTTPNIAICGYVPVAASTTSSTIAAAQTTISADGLSTTTITVQLKDGLGNNLTSSGGTVIIYTTAGTISVVTDNNDGTYTAVLTSAATEALATLTFTINGTLATGGSSSAGVNFTNALALSWLNISVYRVSEGVKIYWQTTNEQNVKGFIVERSLNGTDWTVAVADIPAFNSQGVHTYQQTDKEHISKKVFYRVKQLDMDGRSVYSSVQLLNADDEAGKIIMHPVPVISGFQLIVPGADKIKEMKLVNINGTEVRNWKREQAVYDIKSLPAGVYVLRIEMVNGDIQTLRFSKQ